MRWIQHIFSRFRPQDIPTASNELTAISSQIATQPSSVVAEESRRLAPMLSAVIYGVGSELRQGATTAQASEALDAGVRQLGLYPALLGYNGFPAPAAVSVNEQLLHGILHPAD